MKIKLIEKKFDYEKHHNAIFLIKNTMEQVFFTGLHHRGAKTLIENRGVETQIIVAKSKRCGAGEWLYFDKETGMSIIEDTSLKNKGWHFIDGNHDESLVMFLPVVD